MGGVTFWLFDARVQPQQKLCGGLDVRLERIVSLPRPYTGTTASIEDAKACKIRDAADTASFNSENVTWTPRRCAISCRLLTALLYLVPSASSTKPWNFFFFSFRKCPTNPASSFLPTLRSTRLAAFETKLASFDHPPNSLLIKEAFWAPYGCFHLFNRLLVKHIFQPHQFNDGPKVFGNIDHGQLPLTGDRDPAP